MYFQRVLLILLALFPKGHLLPAGGFVLQDPAARDPMRTRSLSRPDAPAGGGADDDDLTIEAFQTAKEKMREDEKKAFDGYDLRDAIVSKWGKCYDLDFNRVQSFGFKKVGTGYRRQQYWLLSRLNERSAGFA